MLDYKRKDSERKENKNEDYQGKDQIIIKVLCWRNSVWRGAHESYLWIVNEKPNRISSRNWREEMFGPVKAWPHIQHNSLWFPDDNSYDNLLNLVIFKPILYKKAFPRIINLMVVTLVSISCCLLFLRSYSFWIIFPFSWGY